MSSIMFSPMTSIFENKAAGTIIIGMPGSGKSYFIINLLFNALIMEQNIFAIDPKNDLGVLASLFPDKVEYININQINPGALNPFDVIENLDTNTLTSLISIICGNLDNNQITAITPIVKDFINKNKRGNKSVTFSDVADYLYANDNIEAQNIGTKLEIHRDSKYGPLLFCENENKEKFNFSDKSKIISLHGMDLPKGTGNEFERMTEEQKFNSGIVFIICKMLRDKLTKGNYPTIFTMDEAHIAFQNEAFTKIIDDFLILGRSLSIATILASQSVHHFPETISQLIANKFCLKSSTNDAKGFLNMFYNQNSDMMADFDSIIYQIGNFQTGDGYFIDSNNRSGFFKVSSILGDSVSSNPLLKKKREENE